jgi:uncharacterized membrane protein YebE (DUF533 family)
MIDLNKIISGLSQSGAAAGLAGGLAGGTVVGALSSKKGRKAAKSAAKIGGLALVGGLAYKAYRDYQEGQRRNGRHQAVGDGSARAPATAVGAQAPGPAAAVAAADRWGSVGRNQFAAVIEEPPVGESRSLLLVRAMIAAAMADGHLDTDEQGHLFREIDRLDLSAEEKGTMLEELRHPWPMHAIVARCDAPETAIEVYTASVLAIDETRPESELYLSQLARLLQLPPTLVEEIHIRSGSEKALPLAEPA